LRKNQGQVLDQSPVATRGSGARDGKAEQRQANSNGKQEHNSQRRQHRLSATQAIMSVDRRNLNKDDTNQLTS